MKSKLLAFIATAFFLASLSLASGCGGGGGSSSTSSTTSSETTGSVSGSAN